jgi:hypothetical protein
VDLKGVGCVSVVPEHTLDLVGAFAFAVAGYSFGPAAAGEAGQNPQQRIWGPTRRCIENQCFLEVRQCTVPQESHHCTLDPG